MEGVYREGDDGIVKRENSAGMMSPWKGLIGKEMTSSSNMRMVRDDVIVE
jgi:hypothetical protein